MATASCRLNRALRAASLAPLVLIASCSIPPKVVKQVKESRPGRTINDRVAVVYSGHYQVNLLGFERLHPFDINKYVRIYTQLAHDGLLTPADTFVPTPIGESDILRVHTREFVRSLNDPARVAHYLEAPPLGIVAPKLLDLGMLEPFRYAAGGTLLAGRLALRYGIGINLGGGFHHAGPDAGEGFCVYADMPIAIRTLQAEGLIRKALVVDLDVHQGNGTATCFGGDPAVFTFDMHQENIYPIPKAHCSLDVPLSSGTDDEGYLRILREHLPEVFRRAQPDIVFLQAGCDTLADDGLASLRMTERGIVQRDAEVIDRCVRQRVPVVMVLGGGYGPSAWHAQYASIRHIIETYGAPATAQGSP